MKKYLFLLIFPIVIVSCTHVYHLRPSGESRVNANYAQAEQNNITVKAKYSHIRETDVFFDIEITNESNGSFHLQIPDFFYFPCNQVDGLKQCYEHPHFAYNPANERSLIDLAMKQSETDEKLEKAAVGVSFVIGLLGNAASDKSGEEKVVDGVVSAIGHAGTYAAVDENFENYRDMLTQEIYFWTNIAINDTIIAPNETIKGKVGFPYKPGVYDYYQLYLPTDRGDLILEFESYEVE